MLAARMMVLMRLRSSARYEFHSVLTLRSRWQQAAGADLALPQVQGRRSVAMRLANRYMERVLAAAESDTVITERFFRVTNLVDPPARLLHPSVMMRVATGNRRRGQRNGGVQPSSNTSEFAAPS